MLPGLAGGILFAISWAFAGMSVIGQPHIMVRFMALDDQSRMLRARAWYYLWFLAFYAMATGVGMLSRVYLGDPAAFDAELALPTMAQELFPPVLVGLVLAGLFAATISTADSQILSCTAAITHDFSKKRLNTYMANKIATICVTLLALGIALSGNESVFVLVLVAWSTLASAFGPLLIGFALKQRIPQPVALIMMAAGVATVLLWRGDELGWIIYEIAPGMLAGLLVLFLAKLTGHVRTSQSESDIPAPQ